MFPLVNMISLANQSHDKTDGALLRPSRSHTCPQTGHILTLNFIHNLPLLFYLDFPTAFQYRFHADRHMQPYQLYFNTLSMVHLLEAGSTAFGVSRNFLIF